MNSLIFTLPKSIKGGVIFCLTATLVVSGFFVANFALAAHTTSVTIAPENVYVAGGSTNTYTFNITNTGTDPIYKIVITAPGGFTINNDQICPPGWLPSHTGTSAQCLTDAIPINPALLTGGNNTTVSFSVTAPSPGADTEYTWTVDTTDNVWGTSQNTDAKTTVDVTAPVTSDNAPTIWQNNDVAVTLTPNDNFIGGVSGSGVANIYSCVYNSGEASCDPTIAGFSVNVTCNADSVCQKIVRYYSVDKVGNQEAVKSSGTIRIDKEKPVTKITVGEPKYKPEALTYVYVTSATQFTLNATDNGVGTIALTEYKIGDGAWTPYAGSFPVAGTGPTPIFYRSTDSVGNIEDTKTLAVFVDNTAPIVGDINIDPIYGNYISGLSTISASVSDGEGSGIVGCGYTLDGLTWQAANHSGGICSISGINTASASSINVRAMDNVGNGGQGTAVNVVPDTGVPSVNIGNVPENWQSASAGLTINCADDGGSGCSATVGYKLYDNNPGTCPTDSSAYTLGNSVIVSNHQWICAYGEDNVGNSATAGPTEITVDQTIPTITDDYVKDGVWVNSSQTITLTPLDEGGSGINTVKYCEGETCDPAAGIVLTPYTLSYSTAGVVIVKYQVWDKANNPSEVGSFVVKIDLSKPIAGVSGAPGNWTNVTQTATVTCTDTGGSTCDVNSYKLYISTSQITNCSSNVGDYNLSSPQPINSHSWVCSYVKDVAGNENFTVAATEFKVDQILPSGTLTGVPEVWQNGDAIIGLTPSDEGGSGVFKSYLNDVPYAGPITVSTHSTVNWKVVDVAGNEKTGSSEIKVDKIAPISTITSPVAASWQKADFTVGITDTDTGDSGLKTCEYKIGAGGWIGRTCNAQITVTVGAGKNCATEGENACQITVRSTDNATNISTESSSSFSTDWTNPVITINTPITNTVAVNDLIIGATVTDNLTTAPSCTYQFDSGNETSIDCAGGTISIGVLLEGHHTLNFYGTDLAGNKNYASVDFIVNNDKILTVGGTDADFATIQAAIDAATTGDTIDVAAGIYNENLVVGQKLTIQSTAGAASTIINAADANDYVVNITADNVTLDGFTITGLAATNDTLANNAAVITQGVDNCTIKNNILTGNHEVAINLFGGVGGAYSDYNTVSNNIINAPNGQGETYGIKIKGSHNTISGNKIYNADTSIHVWSWDATETASPDYNIISNNIIAQGDGGTANHKYGIEIKTGQYNEVIGNTISVTRAAIHLYTSDKMAGETNFDPRPAHNTISGNIITGGEVGIVLLEGANTNTISGNNISGTSMAGVLGSLSRWPSDWLNKTLVYTSNSNYLNYLQITGNTFKDNTIDNCGHGIAMEYADNNTIGGSDQAGYGNTIQDNTSVADINYHGVTFVADKAGVYFDANSSGNVATYNYWGTAVYSTIAGKISENVTFEPYYVNEVGVNGILSNVKPIAVSVDDSYPTTVTVPTDYYFGYNAFATIQEGINAVASAGTVNVAAGTYTGTVNINKSVSLYGPNADINPNGIGTRMAEAIIDFTGIECGYWNSEIGGVDVPYGTGNVAIKGFIIKGSSNASDALVSIGGNNNTIQNNIVIGDLSSSGQDIGIHIGGGTSQQLPSGNNISGNKVYGHAGAGIFVGNWAGTGNVISGNDIYGNVVGGIAGMNGNGIELDRVLGVTVENNILHNNEAAGIKIVRTAPNANIEIRSNSISNNGVGIMSTEWLEGAIESATVVLINNNKIYSNVGYGVDNTVEKIINAKQNWWGNATGPAHSSNPNGTGNAVSDNVNFRPWRVSDDLSLLVDETHPTVTISSTAGSLTNTFPIPVTIIFSEPVFNFEASDVTVTNGAITEVSFSGLGATYNFTITPTADGAVTVNIADNIAWDLAGNYNIAAGQFSITYDSVKPTLTVVSISSSNANSAYAKIGDTVTLAFTASENIQTPTVTIAGKSAAVTGFNTSWMATYTMTSEYAEGVIAFTIKFIDLAGNPGDTVTTVTSGGGSVTFDNTAPESWTESEPIETAGANEVQVEFPVCWSGNDNSGSGIADYDLWVKDGGNPWVAWTPYTPITSSDCADYLGTIGHQYCFKSRATDNLGNEEADKNVEDEGVSCTDVAAYSFDINLIQGWNLNSLPIVPMDRDAADVLSSLIENESLEGVWTYDPTNPAAIDGWLSYAPGVPSNLTTMTAGYGYWIEMLSDDTLTVVGSLMAPGITPPQRTLVPGWNLIGYYGVNGQDECPACGELPCGAGKETYCALYSMVNTYTEMPRWTSLWSYYGGSFYQVWYDDSMDPGAGYWIALGSDTPQVMYTMSDCP